MPSILVTGAKGQVGNELRLLATDFRDWQFTFIDIDELDLTDRTSVFQFLDQQAFDYCINCAAYTAVDRAESDIALAEAVNVTAVATLAQACRKTNCRLIHLSTDYVYHNSQNLPFKENDLTNPQGIYAKTKLAGEIVARQGQPETLIIRTSWVYSSFGHNFVKTMKRLGQDRDRLTVIYDQIGSPTYARDLAVAMLEIIRQVETQETTIEAFSNLYHYSNEGVTSWYDFAQAIFELSAISCEVSPIETKDYPTAAARPPFSLLNKYKIKQTFGLTIPYWRNSLKDCLSELERKEG